MIELFPAKCRDEILRCGGSVWAGILMKHHNTLTKHATLLVSFCVHPLASSAPSMNTISENEVYQTQFHEEVTMKFVNGEWSVLLNLLLHCTHQIFINHRQSAAPQIIMHIFMSFIKVSHPSPYR
jgi:hypothetical protein